jgi:hypothetical protein
MADKAVESATAGMSEVRLDENGQPLSKNALKKLLKAEAAAKKKAEKAAAKVSPMNAQVSVDGLLCFTCY